MVDQNVKHCLSCGRPYEHNNEKYCSKSCSYERLQKKDLFIEQAITEKLDKIPENSTICPSQIARELFPENWRDQMERVRRASRRLVIKQKILITQKSTPVKSLNFKGPIRIKKFK